MIRAKRAKDGATRVKISSRLGVAVLVAAGVAAVAPASPAAAFADGNPLPTVQINGVVWDQVVVGNTVYATGQFTKARPAGAAKGTSETTRQNILAYDINTGALKTSWAPSLNAQGMVLAASPDGRTIYVGGDFTQVNGTTKNRLVGLDATTGAVTSFNASANARVSALSYGNGTIYAGGSFSTANNVGRARLAAFNASSGALTSWAPSADLKVAALLYAPRSGGGSQVVVAGSFGVVNGRTTYGTAALNPSNGSTLSWPLNQIVQNGGETASGITSLKTDGNQIYGSGFKYSPPGGRPMLEGTFATDLGGSVRWIEGCLGDTYDIHPASDALYKVSHMHDCSTLAWDSFKQTTSTATVFRRASSFSLTPQSGRTNVNSTAPGAARNPFFGRPAPATGAWRPYFSAGNVSGKSQGPWTVEGNGNYLVIGGEFEQVGSKNQQGLVRFKINATSFQLGN